MKSDGHLLQHMWHGQPLPPFSYPCAHTAMQLYPLGFLPPQILYPGPGCFSVIIHGHYQIKTGPLSVLTANYTCWHPFPRPQQHESVYRCILSSSQRISHPRLANRSPLCSLLVPLHSGKWSSITLLLCFCKSDHHPCLVSCSLGSR